MNYLLDVNVLLAWGWEDHVDHGRTIQWLESKAAHATDRFFTSALPQLGFVRVSVQRSRGLISVAEAGETLAGMLSALGKRHAFLADDQWAIHFEQWCVSAGQTTDAHLVSLARAHAAVLATLDTGIPDAFLVPHSARQSSR